MPTKYRVLSTRVHGMGCIACYCALCRGEKVWRIIYRKGEDPTHEDDFGRSHVFVEAPDEVPVKEALPV